MVLKPEFGPDQNFIQNLFCRIPHQGPTTNHQLLPCRLFIKAGKGKKDRYVVLPDKLALLLQEYFKAYPVQYWFVESTDGGPYSARSIQAVFHRALEKAKVEAYAMLLRRYAAMPLRCHGAYTKVFVRNPLIRSRS